MRLSLTQTKVSALMGLNPFSVFQLMAFGYSILRVTRYIETETQSQKLDFEHTLMPFWLREKL